MLDVIPAKQKQYYIAKHTSDLMKQREEALRIKGAFKARELDKNIKDAVRNDKQQRMLEELETVD